MVAVCVLAMAAAHTAWAADAASKAAASAAAQPSPLALDLARQAIQVMRLEANFGKMMETLRPQLQGQMERSASGLTAEQRKAIQDATVEASPGLMRMLIEKAIPIYASVYTEDELASIVTFYGSPAGQAMIAKTPEVTARLAPSLQEVVPALQADILRRTCAKIDCSGLLNSKAEKPKSS